MNLKNDAYTSLIIHYLSSPPCFCSSRVVRAPIHHLTARVVEHDHFEHACSDLLEQEKETNIQLMSNRKCWPTPVETGFTIENRQFDCQMQPMFVLRVNSGDTSPWYGLKQSGTGRNPKPGATSTLQKCG